MAGASAMSTTSTRPGHLFIGLKSGTTLDGLDAVLADLGTNPMTLASQWQAFPDDVKTELQALHVPGHDELDRTAQLGQRIAGLCAEAVTALLAQTGLRALAVRGIGCHGPTVRHQPALGYSLQVNNPSLLAELTGIPVVTDFRARDLAAGGQGGPLAAAFHATLFHHPEVHRAVVNIGGIANITDLPPKGKVIGFDCGPGNLLMDAWVKRHWGCDYDPGGSLSAQGRVLERMLQGLQAHPYYSRMPPKSAGRGDFSLDWVSGLAPANARPEDVLTTLLELTVRGIANAVRSYCAGAREIWLCGGGAHNLELRRRLATYLPNQRMGVTDELGVHVDWVEAFAYAWLAQSCLDGHAGNLPAVTGARGTRILGAIYPA